MTRSLMRIQNPLFNETQRNALQNQRRERVDSPSKGCVRYSLGKTGPDLALVLKLCERFPKLFSLERRKPLKVDVEEDILQDLAGDASISTDGLYKALCYYIKGFPYQRALKSHKHRFDLKGEVCGLVTDPYHLEEACQEYPPRKRKGMPSLMTKLFERFPKAFTEMNRKPLKKGIQKDILKALRDDPDVTTASLSKALNWYVRGNSYLKGLIRNNHRFDLEGNIAGDIDPTLKGELASRLESREKEERRHMEQRQALLEP